MWRIFSRKDRTQPRPSSFRPRLEALEDRCLLSGGVLDPTFGSGGLLTTNVGGQTNSQAYAVATYPDAGTPNDGKVVAAGYSSANGDKFTVVRYNLDGSLDHSFGANGQVANPSGVANDVKIQPDGKIVAAGWSANNFAVVRYNADGNFDSTFAAKAAREKSPPTSARRASTAPDGWPSNRTARSSSPAGPISATRATTTSPSSVTTPTAAWTRPLVAAAR